VMGGSMILLAEAGSDGNVFSNWVRVSSWIIRALLRVLSMEHANLWEYVQAHLSVLCQIYILIISWKWQLLVSNPRAVLSLMFGPWCHARQRTVCIFVWAMLQQTWNILSKQLPSVTNKSRQHEDEF
jgi:hypothetical protein